MLDVPTPPSPNQTAWEMVEVAPEVPLRSSPAQQCTPHSSQNTATCLNIQLADNLPTVFDTGTSRLWKLPFRGLIPYAQTSLLAGQTACLRFPTHGNVQEPVRSQGEHPELLPSESPIYYGTEIAEERLSVENVMRIESKRVKTPVSTFHRQSF